MKDFENVKEQVEINEKIFQNAFLNTSLGMALLSLNGQWLHVNKALLNTLGYSEQELKNMKFIDITHPNDIDNDLQECEKLLKGDISSVKFEKRYIHKLGHIIWMLITVSVARDIEGSPLYFIAQFQDITEHKEMEAVVQFSESRFRRVFEGAMIGIALINKNGKFLETNHALQNILGYCADEINNLDIFTITYEEDREDYKIIFQELIEGKRDSYQLEKRYISKNNKLIWGNIRVSVIRSKDGSPSIIVGMLEDITKDKLNQEKLLQLAAVIDSTPDAVASISLDGTLTSWNSGAEEIYGYSSKEIIGETISILLPVERKGEWEDILRKIQRHCRVHHFETERLRKDKRKICVALTVSPIISSSGNIIGASIISRDMTEHKRLEKEMARLDQLNVVGEMAASISHEIRNPLTSVRGFLQVLGGKKECEKYKDYYNLMIDELDRANSIISEFLSISKKKATELQLHNLNEIVKVIFPLIKADATATGKSIRLELKDVVDILLDDKEIRQVILNLSRNGLDAMSKGGTLIIKTFMDNKDVILAVEDQGNGIDNEILEKIGTPFVTTKDNGTGLGLAICYSIVARHNGKIKIKTSSSGTSFYVHFKIHQ